jgi:CRP-like cAMP-binding protein
MIRVGVRDTDLPPDCELMRGLKKKEIDLILAAATLRRLPAKAVITYQAEPAEQLFLLCKGRARFFSASIDGQRLSLLWITPGRIFGAAALALAPSTYLVSTEALRDSTVLVWDGPTIRELARRFPQLMMNAYLTAMDYISWYLSAHASLTSETARQRLAHVLLGYVHSIGEKVPAGIQLDLTNEELAEAANISLYTVSRLTSEWQRKGVIRKSRKKILLPSDKGLFLPVD